MSQNPIRITLAVSSLGAGGAERNLLFLAAGLESRGYATTVLTLNSDIPDFYAVPPGVKRAWPRPDATASPRWFNYFAQRRRRASIRQSLLETTPDLVISFIDTTNIHILMALADTRIPTIVSERIDWRFHSIGWRWQLLRRFWYPRAERVVSLARSPVAAALRYVPPWRCVNIANPVPKIDLQTLPGPALAGEKNLIAMGRLAPQKGFDLLLQAFSDCARRHPDWHLTVLGQGPLRDDLMMMAKDLGIGDRVEFRPPVRPPFSLLRSADLFVFSSRYEGFGMALAEAMACGLPVISFDCPSGPREIVRDGVDGLLVPAENVEALTAAMDRLMSDPSLRESLAKRAVEVCDRFAPERILDQWCGLIEEVLAEREGAGH